jgi:hypothetical protein
MRAPARYQSRPGMSRRCLLCLLACLARVLRARPDAAVCRRAEQRLHCAHGIFCCNSIQLCAAPNHYFYSARRCVPGECRQGWPRVAASDGGRETRQQEGIESEPFVSAAARDLPARRSITSGPSPSYKSSSHPTSPIQIAHAQTPGELRLTLSMPARNLN